MTEVFAAPAATRENGSALMRAVWRMSSRARERRANYLRAYIFVRPGDRCLDLGGATGAHFHAVFPEARDVTVTDVRADALAEAPNRFGYKTVYLDEDAERLPFPDKFFDMVFCSSVIEHVTGPKAEVYAMKDHRQFVREAQRRQQAFADEIRRVAKSYYVQTPDRNFPLESHTWLPFLTLLPRAWQIRIMAFTRKFWKKAKPDFHLLTTAEMAALFPDAMIRAEHFLGLRKSIMAIKVERRQL